MTDSQTVATPAKGTGTVTGPTPAEKFVAYLAQRAQEEGNREKVAEQVAQMQLERLFEADTDEEIWKADSSGGTIQGRDASGLELRIHAMTVHASNRPEFDTWLGVFVTLDCTCLGGPADLLTSFSLKPGADFVLSTGAPLIIGKVRKFEAKERLPIEGVIATVPGTTGVLRLDPMPVRVTAGSTA